MLYSSCESKKKVSETPKKPPQRFLSSPLKLNCDARRHTSPPCNVFWIHRTKVCSKYKLPGHCHTLGHTSSPSNICWTRSPEVAPKNREEKCSVKPRPILGHTSCQSSVSATGWKEVALKRRALSPNHPVGRHFWVHLVSKQCPGNRLESSVTEN